MKKLTVFLDSDVIISSLISSSGAAHLVINKSDIDSYISNISQKELNRVADRLKIDQIKLSNLIRNKLKIVKLEKSLKRIKEEFEEYTFDSDDAHILAGAKASKSSLLISYNVKDYDTEKIKNDLKIIIMTPAKLLQYLRGLE